MSRFYRAELLERELQNLVESIAGIRGVVIVSIEGFVVASYPNEITPALNRRTQTPQVAAMAATMIALGEQTLARLTQGKVERLMLEGEDGAMIVYPINANAVITALVNKNAKMGLIFLAVAKKAEQLSKILG